MTRRRATDDERAGRAATRRAVLRRAAGASALLALPIASFAGARIVGAKDEGDDHSGGHGRGRGRGGDGGEAEPTDQGSAANAAAPAVPGAVTIVGRGFQPATLTIAPGQTVTWRNASGDEHTASGASFDSGVIPPGGSGVATFAAAGTFAYQCNFHPEMRGTVVVAGEANAPSPASPAAGPDAAANDLVGVWRLTLDAPEFGRYEAVATFHPDGSFATVFAPTGSAPPLGAGQGVWEAGPDGGYRLTVVALALDDAGRFAGTLTLRESGQVDAGGDAFAGSARGDIADASGSAQTIDDATTRGTRITLAAAENTDPAVQATPAAAATPSEVTIRDFAFEPPTVEIAAGATVVWRNAGNAPHTATASDGAFDTGRIDPGQEATVTFDTAGSFAYRCAFHPNMKGTIVVR